MNPVQLTRPSSRAAIHRCLTHRRHRVNGSPVAVLILAAGDRITYRGAGERPSGPRIQMARCEQQSNTDRAGDRGFQQWREVRREEVDSVKHRDRDALVTAEAEPFAVLLKAHL